MNDSEVPRRHIRTLGDSGWESEKLERYYSAKRHRNKNESQDQCFHIVFSIFLNNQSEQVDRVYFSLTLIVSRLVTYSIVS